MSRSSAAHYSEIKISNGSKEVSLGDSPSFNGVYVTGIEYFESVYSPMITLNLAEIDVGGAVVDDKNRLSTVKNALPITGNEDLLIKIETESGTLDLTKYPLKVNGSPTTGQESNRQSVLITAVSQHEMKNRDIAVRSRHKGPISEMVSKIFGLLTIPPNSAPEIAIEKTQNNDGIIGRGKTPFELISGLCTKAIPEKGDPGFFFYETQDGFNFKSIDTLIKQEPVATYQYSGALESGISDGSSDFKILTPPIFSKDQDVLKALKSGSYSCRVITTNPMNWECKESFINLSPETTLGKKQESVPVKDHLKTFNHILDIGSYEPSILKEDQNNPYVWRAKSSMRYDVLHSQIMNIQVPCNVNLRAGDVIKCEIENVTLDNKVNQPINEHQSGKYLILHLCHHFDPERSYTSMTLARDTYGLYTKNT